MTPKQLYNRMKPQRHTDWLRRGLLQYFQDEIRKEVTRMSVMWTEWDDDLKVYPRAES